MGQRLYDAVSGRFLQVDPVPGGSANRYDYVDQDPVDGSDLSGQWHWHHHLSRWLREHRDLIASALADTSLMGERLYDDVSAASCRSTPCRADPRIATIIAAGTLLIVQT